MRLLIWDFDGTLAYRKDGMFSSAMLELLRGEIPQCEVDGERLRMSLESGFPWHTPERPHPNIESAETWWELLLPVFERGFRDLGIRATQASSLACQVRDVYTDPSRWRLFDGALATLDQLQARGWTHALLSNHVPELRAIAHHLDLTSRLVAIFNSAETGYEKPHPRAFRMVLDSFANATSVWMIGDSMRADVAGAEAVGIPAILIHGEDPRARRACANLTDVEPLVARRP